MIPKLPKRRRGRPASNNFNPFAEYLTETGLTVKQFHEIAEEVLAKDYPDLFPPPGYTYLHKIRSGYVKPEKLTAEVLVKLCVLMGCTPNDLIPNPVNVTGRWEIEE